MLVPNRPLLLACAALAVSTPVVAGARIWHYLDEDRRGGLVYVLLYWPSILLDHLPAAATAAFTLSALPMVLMYFGGYLLVCQAVREAIAAWRRRGRA